VLHHGEVVGDEQIGKAEAALQVLQQVDDLRLDRDVEGGDRLVAHDQVGIDRQRAGDADALALAAGELVRIAPRLLGPELPT
jgi:serine kinase of HPr protein (carbohydrate metabolism regulator)